MILPYTGAALASYEKIHVLSSYKTNELYPFKDTYYYINKKGYLHILLLSALSFKGRRSFYISDNLLTKDNKLQNVGQFTRLYDTKAAAIEALKEAANEQVIS
jgi:hypothetical protein